MTTTPAIEVTDLSVAYGETPALVDVDVTIPWGTVCGLVGINGSGKSTLLKAVMGVVRPDTGGIRIDGGTPPAPAVAARSAMSRRPRTSTGRSRSASATS